MGGAAFATCPSQMVAKPVAATDVATPLTNFESTDLLSLAEDFEGTRNDCSSC